MTVFFGWALVHVFIVAAAVGCGLLALGDTRFTARTQLRRGAALVFLLVLVSYEIGFFANFEHRRKVRQNRDDYAYYCTHGLTTYCGQ